MKKITLYIALVSIAFGCTEQQDLFTTSRPLLRVDGDFVPSLRQHDMSMKATAVLYGSDGGAQFSKNYFASPTGVTIPVTRGDYDVLLFNGMMYSESNTHLDYIHFRGTDRLSTFEAVVSEGEPNRRLGRAGDEYIASNEMDTLAAISLPRHHIDNEAGYFIKYKNGKNGYPTVEDYVESSVVLTPCVVSYSCRVVVSLVNPGSAYVANGSLRGFAGSVFLSTRMPSSMEVTHQFRLNDLYVEAGSDPERGSIRSPYFLTFGPPLDQPDRRYTISVSIVLVDGSVFDRTFDVTAQVDPWIARIRDNLASPGNPLEISIPIEIEIELPVVEPIGGSIGMDDWEDEEIIKVPIVWP